MQENVLILRKYAGKSMNMQKKARFNTWNYDYGKQNPILTEYEGFRIYHKIAAIHPTEM